MLNSKKTILSRKITLNIIKLTVLFFGLLMSIAVMPNSPNTLDIAGSRTTTKGVSFTDIAITFELLFNETLKKYGQDAKVHHFEKFSEVEDGLLNTEKYDGFFCNSVEYANSSFHEFVDKNNIFTIQIGDSLLRKIVLVSRNDPNISSVKDLKNKRIKYAIPSILTQLYVETLFLKDANSLVKNSLSAKDQPATGVEATISLMFDQVDAVALFLDEYELAKELNPQLAKSTKVLAESSGMVDAVIALKHGVNSELQNSFSKTMLNMHKITQGKNIIELFGAERFTKITDKDLDSVRDMINIRNKFTGKNFVSTSS